MHIAITGNIGAGKTTLAELLARHYGWEVLYEAVEGNPYLADFYDDMARWAFNLQIFFLNSRFEQVRRIRALQDENRQRAGQLRAGQLRAGQLRAGQPHAGQLRAGQPRAIIQDRTIYEDAAIFARNLYQTGQLPERDYQTYQALFANMVSLVRPPDLMIYLRADLPKLREQIRRRGRPFEQGISDEYLLNLNQLYEEFVASYREGPLLILDVNTTDYARQPADFDALIDQINGQLSIL